MPTLPVFDYVEELDCFVINPVFAGVVVKLGLNEWHPAVWVGRYFALDNDFGEHWFDNWPERDALQEQAEALGYDKGELMVVVPFRFKDDEDGPCHSDDQRKRFWTDVLKSLRLSLETIIEEARQYKYPELTTNELEEAIEEVTQLVAKS